MHENEKQEDQLNDSQKCFGVIVKWGIVDNYGNSGDPQQLQDVQKSPVASWQN